ncbi:hypothetical protein Tco_1001714 [Tanacetum coccineum]
MGEININDLTLEHYFRLTDNHATGSVKSIDDMTIAEYLEYEEIRKAQGQEWFSKVNKDADDLEGILNYLEPVAYEGPINLANEAYNVRRCKLLGMPYNKPPPILKEEAIMTSFYELWVCFIVITIGDDERSSRIRGGRHDNLLIMDAMLREFLVLILLFPV